MAVESREEHLVRKYLDKRVKTAPHGRRTVEAISDATDLSIAEVKSALLTLIETGYVAQPKISKDKVAYYGRTCKQLPKKDVYVSQEESSEETSAL